MLVKTTWDQLNHGDWVYVPAIKIRGMIHRQGLTVTILAPGGYDYYPADFWRVMRYEDKRPHHVASRGCLTGVVDWIPVKEEFSR